MVEGTKDFVDMLKDQMYLQVGRFVHILEHALLLGEV